jgi:hypothetical protein
VAIAKREDSVLQPRQALPDEPFLSLSQVQHATGDIELSIVCISHCWLQPDHPDPRGHNLRVVARALEAYLSWHSAPPDVGVFLDFCSMHQKCRRRTARRARVCWALLTARRARSAASPRRTRSSNRRSAASAHSIRIPTHMCGCSQPCGPTTTARSATSAQATWRRTRSAAGASARRRGR